MPLRHKNVLMVDDDADDQLLFANALQEIDATMNCEIANNGIEALEKLNTFVPDVIFLDLNMPMMNGMECLAAMKKNTKLAHIPVIIFTTTNDKASIAAAKEMGATAFFHKPIEFNRLRQKLLNLFLYNAGDNNSFSSVSFII
ncbi:MAG: response regulator [Chitinophagaceae bacterium]